MQFVVFQQRFVLQARSRNKRCEKSSHKIYVSFMQCTFTLYIVQYIVLKPVLLLCFHLSEWTATFFFNTAFGTYKAFYIIILFQSNSLSWVSKTKWMCWIYKLSTLVVVIVKAKRPLNLVIILLIALNKVTVTFLIIKMGT